MFDTLISAIERLTVVTAISGTEKNLRFITIHKLGAIPVIKFLLEKEGYKHLVLLTAVDYLEQQKFQLTYLLHNPQNRTDIGVRILIDRENATMDSAHELWPTIATYQRELREMFGINFPGSPGVDEDFILEGWHGLPPYRRDFDTKAFAESFFPQREGRETNDPATYMKEKLYPNE
jgi:NADH-quinone oxidoreductase subunit C